MCDSKVQSPGKKVLAGGGDWGGGNGGRIFAGVFNQILLMKWSMVVTMRMGRKQRTSCPTLPKIAIHGNFPLGFDHFISKIMIKNNRQKILPPLPPPQSPPPARTFFPSHMARNIIYSNNIF